jgi:SNF2 family DNA or RNA helicase
MELFSLLNFVAPGTFDDQIAFRARFGALTDLKDGAVNQGLVTELQSLIRPFVLRRLKSDVNISLPPKRELVLFAGLSALQKKFYRWILTKNVAALGAQNSRAMTNVIMQLRKCCNHPYLFAGAEPEPFAEGDHLFENSGKFVILQSLLPYLKKGGHRVLLFSTSVQSLDICQDYLSYAGYSFERLDGSVRGDERHARVQVC